ncbi:MULTISPECIES: nucleoside 2-deoxyribosyltransferase [unclassified Pannonibacter]|uniref:nucleoside 2-deoxyribosyltransferase n=1 Tax=unclassified Pannonibacter TaxID=2627228 RepID=UPI001646C69A|nr:MULTISPECIES: nucleoside 2-deoxyribosyltransferase [unclassified Pannonibacter]
MKICICGSMRFIDAMEAMAERLRSFGHEVETPVREEETLDWSSLLPAEAIRLKRGFIDGHLTRIQSCDAVLIANFDHKNVAGYIGANTLMEVGFAHAFGKPVVLLKAPGGQSCEIEVLALARFILNGDPVPFPQLVD